MSRWSSPIANQAAYRRAGGRRKLNAARQRQAWARRRQVLSRLKQGIPYGGLAALARELGVSKATISRDVQALIPIEPLLALRVRTRTRVWRRRRWR